MSALVVDASVAVKWFVPEDGWHHAEALSASGSRLIAPRLIKLEVANAFRRKVRDGIMAVGQALHRVGILGRYLDEIVDEDDLIDAALTKAVALDHPVYDLIYLETARRYDAVMVTADTRLIRKLDGSGDACLVRPLDHWEA